jgi:hypothetical protein
MANASDSEANSPLFLIQLTSWDRKFRVSPLYLMSAANGTASPTIRRVLDEAIERVISADNTVIIALSKSTPGGRPGPLLMTKMSHLSLSFLHQ